MFGALNEKQEEYLKDINPSGGHLLSLINDILGLVEVSVSDTGIGIAPEHQEKVFEEFRQVGTAAKKIEGTGLP